MPGWCSWAEASRGLLEELPGPRAHLRRLLERDGRIDAIITDVAEILRIKQPAVELAIETTCLGKLPPKGGEHAAVA